MRQVTVLGITLRDLSVRESMSEFRKYLNDGVCDTIGFVSHDLLLAASASEELKTAVESYNMTIFTSPDLLQASGIASRSRERETESALFLKGMLRELEKGKFRLFVVARSSEQLEEVRSFLSFSENPEEQPGGYAFSEGAGEDDAVNEINSFLPDVVFLKMDTEEGLRFIQENRDRINARLIVSLGDARGVMPAGPKKGLYGLLVRRLFRREAERYGQ